jgi:starch synthase (maltosyl-transferring)
VGWEDVYDFWLHDAHIKVSLNDDTENILTEGSQILTRWAHAPAASTTNTTAAAPSENTPLPLTPAERKRLTDAAQKMADTSLDAGTRLSAADAPEIHELATTKPLRVGVSESYPLPLTVERPHSTFTAWYQFFPRSEGAHYDNRTHTLIPGTLKTSLTGLERAKEQGFNVVYLPPVFPVGITHRKGRNNALDASAQDPGSPWAIGSAAGGHDTVDPALGTMSDFKDLVRHAHHLNLEIALDFALQCSPDHPWVTQHPEWFRHKPDGSIAFAENPPKKYQDIYPIYFENDIEAIATEVERILELWIAAGVTIFRVDNPHTKPVEFWQHVIEKITGRHPGVLFLAEAFTRPAMMRSLSYAGFTQSHCYFPWRNTKDELATYLTEVNGDEGFFQHNTFWPSTPDILTAYLRDNGIAGHAIRAVLAALGSPSWGIYNGYELIENVQRPGVEEQLDNEKFEIKVRDWSKASSYGISTLLTALNHIRDTHPCTRSYHNLQVHASDNGQILVFSRYTPATLTGTGRPDGLIVVVNLDAHNSQSSALHLDLGALGYSSDATFTVHDELTGREFAWNANPSVSLAPWSDVAHILSVEY